MNALRTTYDDIPETVTLNIPKEMAHRRGEIIVIVDEAPVDHPKELLYFFGAIPDFPDRGDQEAPDNREQL